MTAFSGLAEGALALAGATGAYSLIEAQQFTTRTVESAVLPVVTDAWGDSIGNEPLARHHPAMTRLIRTGQCYVRESLLSDVYYPEDPDGRSTQLLGVIDEN